MYEIDFEIQIEAPGYSPEEFMEYMEEMLYDKYEGDLSPAVRCGEYYILGTTESETRQFGEVVLPVINDLKAAGLLEDSITIKGFQIVNVMELA